jgi:hypothetical protein
MPSDHRFWSFDGDMWNTHATAEEARTVCENALDYYREYANTDGWAEEVESIMWGPIAERIVGETIDHEPGCDIDERECVEGCRVVPGFDYSCDFHLRPIAEETP